MVRALLVYHGHMNATGKTSAASANPMRRVKLQFTTIPAQNRPGSTALSAEGHW